MNETIELSILIFLTLFFTSLPKKSVKIDKVEWIGLNFDDYPCFQSKNDITNYNLSFLGNKCNCENYWLFQRVLNSSSDYPIDYFI